MAERASSNSNSNSTDSNNKPTALTFRSVLPHEPLPVQDRGYIHLQGGLEPKPKHSDKDQAPKNPSKKKSEAKEGTSNTGDFYWTKKGLEEALQNTFSNAAGSTSDSSNNLPHGKDLESVTVLVDASSPPYTKVRLCYSSPLAALQVVQAIRTLKLTPQDLLSNNNHNQQPNQNDNDDTTNTTATVWQFPARSLQVTLLTTQPFLSNDIAWNRSNPPKFRRLICRPGEPVEALQEERDSTRFVFISGLVSPTAVSAASTSSSWWDNPRNVCEAIRTQLREYDSSNLGIEVYVSNKKNDNKGGTHFCHVGMRSPEDARALILGLQGKSLRWTLDWDTPVSRGSSSSSDASNNQNSTAMPSFGPIQSDKLFLDYAAVTKRSEAKATARENGETGDIKGEPSRSECTSTTKDVIVPGLVLVPDFVSPDEEEVLMAALTGPTAPWAPSQKNFSQTGAVKRRVQHYGYVFDYETANVLRDRAVPGADCPPVPGLPEALESTGTAKDDPATSDDFTQPTNGASSTNVESTMENYCERCVTEGRGWDALACIMERARRKEFVIPDHESGDGVKSTTQQYSQLNQITVNLYEPGEGIGSHVDTPSAFADGLMSISLNAGIVMEFRKQDSEKEVKKKLVYLPARSLILMSGPARYEWEHHIVTRMTDTHDGKVLPRRLRASLTLRTAIDLSGEAMPLMTTRSFPPVWGDGAAGKAPGSVGALVTPSMEREHVHAVYDAIATQWHHTRGKRGVLWPGATQFLTELPPGSIVADVGAGDGKYFPGTSKRLTKFPNMELGLLCFLTLFFIVCWIF